MNNVLKCDNKNNQAFFNFTTRKRSVNRNDLRAFTLAGPPQLYQGSGPVAVLHLDNPLYIIPTFLETGKPFEFVPWLWEWRWTSLDPCIPKKHRRPRLHCLRYNPDGTTNHHWRETSNKPKSKTLTYVVGDYSGGSKSDCVWNFEWLNVFRLWSWPFKIWTIQNGRSRLGRFIYK